MHSDCSDDAPRSASPLCSYHRDLDLCPPGVAGSGQGLHAAGDQSQESVWRVAGRAQDISLECRGQPGPLQRGVLSRR